MWQFLATLVVLIYFFFCVNPHMDYKFAILWECLVTMTALVWIISLLFSVNAMSQWLHSYFKKEERKGKHSHLLHLRICNYIHKQNHRSCKVTSFLASPQLYIYHSHLKQTFAILYYLFLWILCSWTQINKKSQFSLVSKIWLFDIHKNITWSVKRLVLAISAR